jgi:hypothetical protein
MRPQPELELITDAAVRACDEKTNTNMELQNPCRLEPALFEAKQALAGME